MVWGDEDVEARWERCELLARVVWCGWMRLEPRLDPNKWLAGTTTQRIFADFGVRERYLGQF
jgi:hypothetical protein